VQPAELSQGGAFTDLSSTGATIWVAGGRASLLHFDGLDWHSAPLNSADRDALLTSVWAADAGEVWAVGPDRMVHLRDNKESAEPKVPPQRGLTMVRSAIAGQAWAVGRQGAVLKYSKGAWSDRSLPPSIPGGSAPDLYAVLPLADGTVWVGGPMGNLFHWNGTSWAAEPLRTDQDIVAIWGTSQGQRQAELWVGTAKGWLYRKRGLDWDHIPLPTPGGRIKSLDGPTVDNLWATASDGALHHFDGMGWTQVNGLPPDLELARVVCVGATDVWAVGRRASAKDGTVLHCTTRNNTHDCVHSADPLRPPGQSR
jgi:hypothetical protein